MARARNPPILAVDALVTPWGEFAHLYLFFLPPIPRVPKQVKMEGTHAIMIAPDGPRRAWYVDLVKLLADAPWPLHLWPVLLS